MNDNQATKRVDHSPRVLEAIDEWMCKKDAFVTREAAAESWNTCAELGSGKLTAEQVRNASHGHYELQMVRDLNGDWMPQVTFDWQAIADELNTELGSGTCEMARYRNALGYIDEWQCFECGADVGGIAEDTPPNFCPNCGKAVKR